MVSSDNIRTTQEFLPVHFCKYLFHLSITRLIKLNLLLVIDRTKFNNVICDHNWINCELVAYNV